MAKVTFILNGSKKSSHSIAARLRLELGGLDYASIFTHKPSEADKIAKQAAADSEIIIAVGGDGTLNECANGIMVFGEEYPNSGLPVFGFIPAGSGNDFSKNLNIEYSVKAIRKRIQQLKTRDIDIGVLQSGTERKYFLNETSSGLTAEVVKHVNCSPKPLGASLAYIISGFKAMVNYRKRELEIRGEDFYMQSYIMATVAANGKWFGSGLCIAPDALIDDGLFDVTIIGNVTAFEYVRNLPRLKAGKKIIHPEVKYFKSPWLEIMGEGQMECDGELALTLPVRIEIIRNALKVLV